MTSPDRARPRLVIHRDAAEVYGINTLIAAVMVFWSWLALPAGSHTLQEVLWGGSVVVLMSWAIAFLVAGLPLRRTRPDAQR
jgi:hypothetical protein